MGIDAPNLQGANLRQVVASGDQASQLQQAQRKESPEFQSRLNQLVVKETIRSRDQTDASDMVVKRQEDNAQFGTGDALLGGGGGGGDGDRRRGNDEDGAPDEQEQHTALAALDAPFEATERLRTGLFQGGREAGDRYFRGVDRNLLAGLVEHPTTSAGSEVYRRQAILTSGSSDTVRRCLETALRDSIALSTGSGCDLDRLRKLLSLARQACRTEIPGPGRDLHDLAGHMLVRISRQDPDALAESVGLLSELVGSFRDWRATNSGAMVNPWNRSSKA
jgi:hypothetical protein